MECFDFNIHSFHLSPFSSQQLIKWQTLAPQRRGCIPILRYSIAAPIHDVLHRSTAFRRDLAYIRSLISESSTVFGKLHHVPYKW